jgi:hypothetical protein
MRIGQVMVGLDANGTRLLARITQQILREHEAAARQIGLCADQGNCDSEVVVAIVRLLF